MSALVKFTKKEYAFIEDKYGSTKKQVDTYSEDELYDLQDKCSDLEIEAIEAAGDETLSDEGKTAAEIVTKIGNTLCPEEGDEGNEE